MKVGGRPHGAIENENELNFRSFVSHSIFGFRLSLFPFAAPSQEQTLDLHLQSCLVLSVVFYDMQPPSVFYANISHHLLCALLISHDESSGLFSYLACGTLILTNARSWTFPSDSFGSNTSP